MNQPIQPYLHFADNCKEAMQFYQSLFGGELSIMAVKDSPGKAHFPEEVHNQVLHSSLINGGFYLMASDMCGQGELKQGNSVQLNINCSSEEEINTLYQKLTEGGKILEKLNKPFWGGLFAMIIDKYGVRWMLSYEKK